MSGDKFELVEGSGNVFRDFGDPLADLKQAKAILAARIIAVLDGSGLTVRKAAERTGFAAADFSRVRNADLGRFTLDRLMKMLAALDGRLQVTVQIEERSDAVPDHATPDHATSDRATSDRATSDRAGRIVLSERDSARVQKLLDDPPEPTPALVAAARRITSRT